jgi:hypothetical protein
MAQVSDVSIANQGFSAFRTELNSILAAMNTSHAGSSAPASLAAGSMWLDTSGGATSHLLKFYDGTHHITFATINTTANTVDFSDSSVSVADDSITLAKMASGTDGNIISYDASGNPVAVATGSSGQVLTSAGAGAPPTFATASVPDDSITLAKMASGTDGNIISYDASGNPVAIATGSSGQVLTSAGAGAPPTFSAAAGGGKILQVIHKKLTSNYSMSSGTTTDVTGLSQAITMASSSNHLLVLGNYVFRLAGNGATVTPSSNTFVTNSSNANLAGAYFLLNLSNNNHNPTWTASQCAYLTPGTTDAYTVKVRTNNASEGGLVQFYGSSDNSYSTNLTLMEIAA